MNKVLSIEKRLTAFSRLGELLLAVATDDTTTRNDTFTGILREVVDNSSVNNGWFTLPMIKRALVNLSDMLKPEVLGAWIGNYPLENKLSDKVVLVVSAGNIPAVGFHDWLCVLMSGRRYLGKLSSDDRFFLPAMSRVLEMVEPGFSGRTAFVTEPARDFDAVIATGSGNTSRYFEYYFSKWPNIVRANRTGLAVLDGRESASDLEALADDILLYYGLGCRNVSVCFVPAGYDAGSLCKVLSDKTEMLMSNHKWANNYDYQKALLLVNKESFADTGGLLLHYSTGWTSPVAVVSLVHYSDSALLGEQIALRKNEIQCVMSSGGWFRGSLPFGTAQNPGPADYADGVDVMDFLLHRV